MAENTKRRAIAAAHSLIQRWSEAEDDGGEPPRDFPPSHGGAGRFPSKPSKPPRPAVSPQSYEGEEDLLPSPVAADESARGRVTAPNPVPRPRTTILQPKLTETDTRMDEKYETVMREMESASKIELATVEVIDRRSGGSDDAKWVDAKLMEQPEHLVAEVTVPDDHLESIATVEHRGLRMRVTGEMPKAYSRGEKDSARKAFMLAPPVGIESSSEASDSEPLPSRHGAYEPTVSWDEQGAEVDDGMEPLPLTSVSESGKPVKLPLYAKPYKSFGAIETKTDALEEALREEELKKKAKVPVSNIKGMSCVQWLRCSVAC